MEPALKQRLVGATVLVALAVVFLPMLIKGPAPESTASNVPLELPDAPKGEFETRELPLVGPGEAPASGAVGLDAGRGEGAEALPTVDTAATATTTGAAVSPATAGGDYAVSFGSYASSTDAARVVAALAAAQLPALHEPVTADGRTVHRVRVGPYPTRAEAEAARLRASAVNTRVSAKVVVLDADAAAPAAPAPPPASPAGASASVSRPAPTTAGSVSAPVALPESRPAPPQSVASAPATRPAATTPAATKPPATQPASPAPVASAPAKPVEAPRPAAAAVGFAVQLGAFGNADEAAKLRDRARAAGFSAFVEAVRTDKGTLNRVRVGPVATREAADQLKSQVAARLGADGIVRPHP